MKYEPDPYIVKIRERKDTYSQRLYGPPIFNCYTEAWVWLRNYRQKELELAKKRLAAQERAYKRVMAIKPKNLVEQPQEDGDDAPMEPSCRM